MNPAATTPPFDVSQCRSLYVGNLNLKMTEDLLRGLFSAIAPLEACKLIKDKNTGLSSGYGFVDFFDHRFAALALQNLNGKVVYGNELRVNWAFASGQKEDTSSHHHVFVGDLSPEIDDKALYAAFTAFGTISNARVMLDQNTGRSRGYGFVAFRTKEDAERALTDMNGEWLGSRTIRCNWANQKIGGQAEAPAVPEVTTAADGTIIPVTNTTVYVGGIAPDVHETLLTTTFSPFGEIAEIRIQRDKGYAFVRFAAHTSARAAIAAMNGQVIGSKSVKCSWGKEKAAAAAAQPPPPYPHPYPPPAWGAAPPHGYAPYPYPPYAPPPGAYPHPYPPYPYPGAPGAAPAPYPGAPGAAPAAYPGAPGAAPAAYPGAPAPHQPYPPPHAYPPPPAQNMYNTGY